MNDKKYNALLIDYKESALQQFKHHKMLAERSFSQIDEPAFFRRHNEDSNSIAHIIQHLSGNMRSRWTDFLTTDGEKEDRNRDLEFEDHMQSKLDLMELWEEGWSSLFVAVEALDTNDWEAIIYIRKEPHTVVQAVNRQLTHVAYHVGQIVFCAKMFVKTEWKSLSIPKGESQKHSQTKFIFPPLSKGE